MRNLHYFLFFSLCIQLLNAVPLIPSKVIYAIDSGSPTSSKSNLGFLYQKVTKFHKKILKKIII